MSASSLLPYDNIIDADGHINEPPDLWENYLEPQYRDRALRFRWGSEQARRGILGDNVARVYGL